MSMNQNQKAYLIAVVTSFDERSAEIDHEDHEPKYSFGFPDGKQARDFIAKAKTIPDSDHLTWDIYHVMVYPSDCVDAALDRVRKDIEEEGL